jgi:hypothetical protein
VSVGTTGGVGDGVPFLLQEIIKINVAAIKHFTPKLI